MFLKKFYFKILIIRDLGSYNQLLEMAEASVVLGTES
jgi:hypothetical protein